MAEAVATEQKFTIGRHGVKIPEFTSEVHGPDRHSFHAGRSLWNFFYDFWELNGQPLPEDSETPWSGEYVVHGSTEKPLVIVRGDRSKQYDEVGFVNTRGETFAECNAWMSEKHSVLAANLGESALSNVLTAYVDLDRRLVTEIALDTRAKIVDLNVLSVERNELPRIVERIQDSLR